MYTNFKTPLFQKFDVQAILQDLKSNTQECHDNLTKTNQLILANTIDTLSLTLHIPQFADEIFRTAQPPIPTQFEIFSVLLNKWQPSEAKDQLISSIRRLQAHLFLHTPNHLKQHVSKSKQPPNLQDVPLLTLEQYMSTAPFEGPYLTQYTTLLRVLRISVLVTIIKSEKLIQALINALKSDQQVEENQVRILDLLIYLCREDDEIKQITVEQGALRVLLTKCGNSDITADIAKRTLTLLRDFCKGNWMTTDLMSRYETEKYLMKLMQKFNSDKELNSLISSILELLIKGYDLDLDNLEKNLKITQERLTKYVGQKNEDCDAQKAMTNVDVLRFYSLMQSYVQKMIGYKLDELLLRVYEKELAMIQDQDHLRLIVCILLVLERMSVCFVDKAKLQHLLQMICQSLPKVSPEDQTPHLTLLYTLMTQEETKLMAAQMAKQLKMENILMELQNPIKSNQKIINDLLLILAKTSGEQADNIVKKMKVKTKNLELIATLSDIPQATKTIMQDEKVLFGLIEVLSSSNKAQVAKFPQYSDDEIDNNIYELMLVPVNDKQPDETSSKIMEILRKLAKTKEFKQKLVKKELVQEILRFLRSNCHNRDQCILALRVLNELAQEYQSLLQEEKGVESIFFALNAHPTDKDIQELAGNVLKMLDAEEISKSVKVQYDDLKTNFDPNDPEGIDSIRQANIYLSNLLAAIPDEESKEIISQNKKVVSALQHFFIKELDEPFLASLLLLLSRLTNQGDETKTILRNSDVPIKLVNYIFMGQTSPQILELGLDAMVNMMGGGNETLHLLNSETGEDEEQETEEVKLEYVNPAQKVFLKYNGKPIEKLVMSLSNIKNLHGLAAQYTHSSDSMSTLFDEEVTSQVCQMAILARASQLLAILARNDPQNFLPILQQQYQCHQSVLAIFKELGQHHLPTSIKAVSFQICGQLLAELARSDPNIFITSCIQVLQSAIEVIQNTKIDDSFLNTLSQMEQISHILKFFKVFLDNNYDKTVLGKLDFPAHYSTMLKSMLEYFVRNLKFATENAFFCILLRDALDVLTFLVADPLCSREVADILPPIMELLKLSKKLEPVEGDDEIYGSSDPFTRIIEKIYRVLLIQFGEVRFCSQYHQRYEKDDSIAQVGLTQNPYLVTKTLQMHKQIALSGGNLEYLKQNMGRFEKASKGQYGSIGVVVRCCEELKGLLGSKNIGVEREMQFAIDLGSYQSNTKTGGNKKVEEQSVVKDEFENVQQRKKRAAEGDVNESVREFTSVSDISDALRSLDKMANQLELYLTQALDNQKISIDKLLKLIEAIKNYTVDNESAGKIHHMEITNTLLSLMMLDDYIDHRVNLAATGCLAHIFQFGDALKSFEKKISLIDPYKSYTQYLLKAKESECAGYFLSIMKNALIIEEVHSKLIKQGMVLPLPKIAFNLKNVGNLTKAAECLDRYGVNEKIAQLYYDEKLCDLIIQQFQANLGNSSFVQGFCLLIGTMCRYQPAQALLSQQKVYQLILQAMNQDDVKLLANGFYAISGLCYNNKAISQEVLGSGIIKKIQAYIGKYESEPILIETICSVISNLTFKNDNNKKVLGEAGVVQQLVQLYNHYAFHHPHLRNKTIKQILRALGNVCFLIDNTHRLINDTNFIHQSLLFITDKIDHTETGEILRYTLDVYSNVCSHPEDQNRSNIELIIKANFVQPILHLLKKNILLSEVVLSAMDTLDGLVQSKMVSVIIASNSGIDTIIKIIKSHDWNDVVINKAFRLLANISLLKQNSEHFLNAQVAYSLADSLKNQKAPTAKLLTYAYKTLHRVAHDKTKDKQLYKFGYVEAITEILSKRGTFDNHLELVTLLNRVASSQESLDLIARKSQSVLLSRMSECPKDKQFSEKFISESLNLLEKMLSKSPQNIDMSSVIFVFQTQLNDPMLSVENKQLTLKAIIALAIGNESGRKLCISNGLDKNINLLKMENKTPQLKSACVVALQAIYNQQDPQAAEKMVMQQQSKPTQDLSSLVKFATNGVPAKLYRNDGSSKLANIQVTKDLQELVAKQPNGVIKKKYRINLNEISFTKFNYSQNGNDWNQSVFAKTGIGMFSKKPLPEKCFTVNGPISVEEGALQINAELNDAQIKSQFENALKSIIHALKTGELKR